MHKFVCPGELKNSIVDDMEQEYCRKRRKSNMAYKDIENYTMP